MPPESAGLRVLMSAALVGLCAIGGCAAGAGTTGPALPLPITASYTLTGPTLSPLAHARAVKLLTSWDQAAPQTPPPTTFDNSQITGTAAGQGIQSLRVQGAVLTFTFAGGAIPKNQNCGYDYTASALASTRAVAIFVNADPGTWPGGQDTNCAYVAKSMTATITLPQPLGDRSVLDVTTGSVVEPASR